MKPTSNKLKEKDFLNYAKEGNIIRIKEMIWNGDVNINCSYKESINYKYSKDILSYALMYGHLDLCIYLVNIGFDVRKSIKSVINQLIHRQNLDTIEYVINSGFDETLMHQRVCVNLIGSNKFSKLYKYSQKFKIDPIKYAINCWKFQLDSVSNYYKKILEKRIKNEKKLYRDYRISSIIETS